MRPPALGHPNYQLPFCLFVYEKKGMSQSTHPKHGDHYQPSRVLQPTAEPYGTGISLPQSLSCYCPLVKATEEIIMGFHLTFCTPCIQRGIHGVYSGWKPSWILIHPTLSVSCSTSYEILLLTAPHISLSHLLTSALLLFSPPSLQNTPALPDTIKKTASMNYWWENTNKTVNKYLPFLSHLSKI